MTGLAGTRTLEIGGWASAVITSEDQFGRLADEWDSLVGRCESATPFQTSGWLLSWWRHYGRSGELRVTTVRRHGVLVAAAAMFVERRSGVAVLAPVGRDQSDMTDILVDDQYVEEAAARLASALLAQPGWNLADLPEVRPDAAARHLARVWPGRRWEVESSLCLELPGGSIEDLLARCPKARRKSLRRRLRGVADAGIDSGSVPPTECADAVQAMVELHEQQWVGRGGEVEHLSDRFRGLLADAVAALAPQGGARIEEHTEGGRVVALELLLIGRAAVYSYFLGVAPALRDRLDTAALTIGHDLTVTTALGRPALSLLRGDEAYKRRWSTDVVTHQRLLLAPPRGLLVRGYVLRVRGRAAGRRWLVDRHPDLHQVLGETRRRLSSEGVAATLRMVTAALWQIAPSRRERRR